MCVPAIAKRRYVQGEWDESHPNIFFHAVFLPLHLGFPCSASVRFHSFARVGVACDVKPDFSNATKSHRRSRKTQDASWNSMTRAVKLISAGVSVERLFALLRTPVIPEYLDVTNIDDWIGHIRILGIGAELALDRG